RRGTVNERNVSAFAVRDLLPRIHSRLDGQKPGVDRGHRWKRTVIVNEQLPHVIAVSPGLMPLIPGEQTCRGRSVEVNPQNIDRTAASCQTKSRSYRFPGEGTEPQGYSFQGRH